MGQTNRIPIGRRTSNNGHATFAWSAFVALTLASIGVAHTWTRVGVLERKYQIARDHSEHDRLVEQFDKLKLEAATWDAQAKVDEAARGTLKMAKPPPTEVIAVDPVRIADSAIRPQATLATNER